MYLKNCTILFIEDDLTTQEHMKMLLTEDVKKIYQAYDGKMGLELYKSKQPDIIIADINLPYISGLELAKKIKEENPTQSIIFMSAYSDRDKLLESINIGGEGFITKPIDMTLLYEKLHQLAKKIQQVNIDKKETQNKIEHLYKLAHYDSLTHLPNRLLFEQELSEYIKIAQEESLSFFLCFLDLDNFKTINDTYGHEAGDFVLKTITNKISQSILSRDIISRRSGDEFLILLKSYSSPQQVKQLAYNILRLTSQAIQWKDANIYISCSIGISQFPNDSTKMNELIDFADLAMYKAKKSGKDKYSFYTEN